MPVTKQFKLWNEDFWTDRAGMNGTAYCCEDLALKFILPKQSTELKLKANEKHLRNLGACDILVQVNLSFYFKQLIL